MITINLHFKTVYTTLANNSHLITAKRKLQNISAEGKLSRGGIFFPS